MKNGIVLAIITMVLTACSSVAIVSNENAKDKPSGAYKQQMENLEKGIYFRGVGNEPEWSLKISEKTIDFNSLIPEFESLSGHHVEPLQAMDANVKMYRVTSGIVALNIQIMKQECVNTMSGDQSAFSVRIELIKEKKSIFLNGCGNYITDPRLHDIWVLEQLNGQKVKSTFFTKELPALEINSSTNRFMGYAGCNHINGTIFFERGLLSFSNSISSTRMVCAADNKEKEFLKALQSTTTYTVENLRLILRNPSGTLAVFRKVD